LARRAVLPSADRSGERTGLSQGSPPRAGTQRPATAAIGMLVRGKRQRSAALERRRFELGDTKHLDCVMREAQCRADSSTFQYTMKQALESEISRMRSVGAPAERIAAFRAAAEVHIALCNAGASPESIDDAAPSPNTFQHEELLNGRRNGSQ